MSVEATVLFFYVCILHNVIGRAPQVFVCVYYEAVVHATDQDKV